MKFRSILWLVATMPVLAFLSMSAYALDFDIQGNVAVVSGEADYPDVGRIRSAVKQGVDTFVLRNIAGGDVEANEAIAGVFEDLKVTMAADGICTGACPGFLLAGHARRYVRYPGSDQTIVIIRGAVFSGDFSGPANISDLYAAYRRKLGPSISNQLLNKHTTGNHENNGLLFIAPAQDWPRGLVMDCEDLDLLDQCQPVDNADPLNAGLFSSSEALDLTELRLAAK